MGHEIVFRFTYSFGMFRKLQKRNEATASALPAQAIPEYSFYTLHDYYHAIIYYYYFINCVLCVCASVRKQKAQKRS